MGLDYVIPHAPQNGLLFSNTNDKVLWVPVALKKKNALQMYK